MNDDQTVQVPKRKPGRPAKPKVVNAPRVVRVQGVLKEIPKKEPPRRFSSVTIRNGPIRQWP